MSKLIAPKAQKCKFPDTSFRDDIERREHEQAEYLASVGGENVIIGPWRSKPTATQSLPLSAGTATSNILTPFIAGWLMQQEPRKHGFAQASAHTREVAPEAEPVIKGMLEDDPEEQFRDAAREHGIELPAHLVADGQIHRFSTDTNGRRDGGKPGWYVLHLDGVPAGAFGDWRIDGEGQKWCAKLNRPLSKEERVAHAKRVKAAQQALEAEKLRRQKQAAKETSALWEASVPATEHPYLAAKKVQAHGLRVHDGKLIMPLHDEHDAIHSYQSIDAEGNKLFAAGGRKAGLFYRIGEIDPAGDNLIGEGFASMASCREVTGKPAIVALDCGNLLAVAKALRKKHPNIRLIFCCDHDAWTEGNPGESKAIQAAQAVGGKVAVPVFADLRSHGETDFNDLRKADGDEAVRLCVEGAKEPERQPSEEPEPEPEPAGGDEDPAPWGWGGKEDPGQGGRGGQDKEPPPPPPEPAEDGSNFTLTPFKWIEPEKIPPRQWIYNRHYIRRYASATIAASKMGKTSLVIAEALVIVTGRPLLGVKPRETCNVAIWNGEDPIDELQRRVTAAMKALNMRPEEIEGKLFLDSGRTQPLIIASQTKQGTVIAVPVVDRVIEQLIERNIGVLMIDPFISCHQVPENDNGAIDRVTKTWGRISDKADCAVDLSHHIRKGNGAAVVAEDARGGGSFIAAVRCARTLNRMSEDQAKAANIDNRKSYFMVSDAGGNLSAPSDEAEWYKFESIELGNGDTVGAVKKWKWPSLFAENAPGDLQEIQRRIMEGQWRADPRSANWAGNVVAEVLELDLRDKDARKRVSQMIKVWIENKVLKVVKRKDENRIEREWIEVGSTIVGATQSENDSDPFSY